MWVTLVAPKDAQSLDKRVALELISHALLGTLAVLVEGRLPSRTA